MVMLKKGAYIFVHVHVQVYVLQIACFQWYANVKSHDFQESVPGEGFAFLKVFEKMNHQLIFANYHLYIPLQPGECRGAC